MPTIAMVRRAPLDDYVVETLLPDLVGHDRSPSSFIVFVKLWHDAGGADRRIQISLSTLAVETGLSKSSVQAALGACASAAISARGGVPPPPCRSTRSTRRGVVS